MKRALFFLSSIGFALQSPAQAYETATEEQALNAVVDQFMVSTKTKGSVKHYPRNHKEGNSV